MLTNYFITRRTHDLGKPIEKKVVIDDLGREFPAISDVSTNEIIVTDSLDFFHEIMKNHDEFGLDTENNSLNQFYADQLLTQIGIPGISFVIDEGSIKEDYMRNYLNKIYIGINLQYDYRILKYKRGWEFRRLIDVMINEQIINRGSGRLNNAEALYERRIGQPLPEDKSTRNDFKSMTQKSTFRRNHIVYSGFDPQIGLQVLPIQQEILGRFQLDFRANCIAMPLIPILGDMNLEGRTLNKKQWSDLLEQNKRDKFKYELQLDAIVKTFAKDNVKLRGGIWSSASRKRRVMEVEQTDLFGISTTTSNESVKNISYGSSKQLAKLFNILKEPLPQTEDKDAERVWGEDAPMKVSFDEPSLEQYKIEYPESRMTEFINILLQHKEVSKAISSFGEIYLKEYVKDGKQGKKHKRGYYQPLTDKIHTIYKQEFTENGRISSGGDKKKKGELGVGFDNSQNWVKKNEYRNCVTLTQQEIDEGWLISTSDLTAAELVILASKSKDTNLMKYCREDLHSYLASHSYTKVIEYILNTMNANRAYDELYELLKVNRLQKMYLIDGKYPNKEQIDIITRQRVSKALETRALTVNKKEHPDIREPYKNVTYGIVYGAQEHKIAKTLNIAGYYARLVIEGINIAIPEAMRYLRAVARFAVKNGYIEFNERTHSRKWFKYWLEARESGRDLSSFERSSIERETKNIVCSGTQADALKECMVEIDKYVRSNNIDFTFLLTIHDEIVYKHKDKNLRKKIEEIMSEVCNRYLTGITMEVAGHTGIFWHKD